MSDKQTIEFKQFIQGIVSTASAKDIPPETPSYSLNIDPVAQSGRLQSIQDHDDPEIAVIELLNENHQTFIARDGSYIMTAQDWAALPGNPT